MTTGNGQFVKIELRREDAGRVASHPVPEVTRHQIMASGLPGVKERFSADLNVAAEAVLRLAKLYAGER